MKDEGLPSPPPTRCCVEGSDVALDKMKRVRIQGVVARFKTRVPPSTPTPGSRAPQSKVEPRDERELSALYAL